MVVASQTAAWLGLAAACLIDWPSTTRSLESEALVPLWAIQALQLSCLAAFRSRRGTASALLLSGAAYVLLEAPDGLGATQATNWVHATLTTLAVASLVTYLGRGAAYADELVGESRRAAAAALHHENSERAHNESRRLLHDEVISALNMIGNGLPAATQQAASARALAVLELRGERRERNDSVSVLARIANASPLTVNTQDDGWATDPSPPVVEAMMAASSEALRNVQRHSGVGRATLRASSQGPRILLTIADQGRGITAGKAPGFGIQRSITDRMAAVGGRAEVTSSPGKGTVVRLTWSPCPDPGAVTAINPLAVHGRLLGYQLAVLPVAASHFVMALTQPTRSRTASVLLACLLGWIVLATARRLAKHPATPRTMLVLAPLVLLLTAVGLTTVPDSGLLNLSSWPIDFAALILVLAAFEAPLRLLLLPVAAQIAVVVGFAVQDPTVGVLDPFGAYFAAIVPVGFAYAVGRLIQSGTRNIHEQEAARSARRDEEAWQRSAEEARHRLRSDIDDRVRPLLERVARVGAADEVAVTEGRHLAAQLRDVLNFEDPLPTPLRIAVDEARARGLTVGVRRGVDTAASDSDTLAEVLALVTAADSQVVTVFTGPDARVVVVPGLRPSAAIKVSVEVGKRCAVQGDHLRTTIRLTQLPRVP
jgi:hypothetical protein